MNRSYTYITDCVNSTYEDITSMVEQEKDITYRSFLRYVPFQVLCELFPFYDTHPRQGGLMLCNDWHVSYHRSIYKGQKCYFVRHSGIEYIFINTSDK